MALPSPHDRPSAHQTCGSQTRAKLAIVGSVLLLMTGLLLLTLRAQHERARLTLLSSIALYNRTGHERLQIPYFEEQPELQSSIEDDLTKLIVTSLQDQYQAQAQQLRMAHNVSHVPFHWVITSCGRNHWGRTMTTTILSGLMNGLQPESITIAWCRPFDKDKVPSLLYNLRHSMKLRVFYLPEQLPQETSSTMMLSLLIPRLLGNVDIALMVTEDDVVFAPDAGNKLSWLLQQSDLKASGAPFFLNLYNPPKEPLGSVEEAVRLYNSQTGEKSLMFPRAQTSQAGALKQSKMSFWYGCQGGVLSPALTHYFARYMYMVMTDRASIDASFKTDNQRARGGQDQVLKDFLVRFGCSFKYEPDAPCHVFNVEPSLVQHVGTASATFKPQGNATGNPRFHLAIDFPIPVEFPLDDGEQWWR